MKIFITGSNGFTGYHLINKLKQKNLAYYEFKGDLRDTIQIDNALKESMSSHVVNLAAITHVKHPNIKDFYEVNVIGSQNLIAACNLNKNYVKSILLFSSAIVYGDLFDNIPIKEDFDFKIMNHYALSKFSMEQMVNFTQCEIPINIVRPFNFTGYKQDTSFVIPKIVDHFRNKKNNIELGNIDVKREFNDVRWVIEAILSIIQSDCSDEIFNICSGQSYSIKDIIQKLELLTSHKINIQINEDFIRKNDISNLIGCPKKLYKYFPILKDIRKDYSIESLLSWMLV